MLLLCSCSASPPAAGDDTGEAQGSTTADSGTESNGPTNASTSGGSDTGSDSTGADGDSSDSTGADTDGPSPIPTECIPDPEEAANDGTRVKSPTSQMRYTAGLPFRILADYSDPNAWMCPPGHPPYVCPGSVMHFYVDGALVGDVPPSPDEEDHFELRLVDGLPIGDHDLTVSYVRYDPETGGAGEEDPGAAVVTITVDEMPEHAETISLTEDVVLGGSMDLDWSDKTVIGNGHRVTSSSGYSGSVTIDNAFITGLGDYDVDGIDIETSGDVTVRDSIFEATGAVSLSVNGSAGVLLRNNEFRSNNFITYVASDPQRSHVLTLSGDTSGDKTLQGNRFGGGIVRLVQTNGWQIGGLAAGEGNVLVGPRAVIHLVSSSNNIIQGNYDLHDYHGGWSQGFNLWLEGGSTGELAEYNVIQSGSWPVQSFDGEFRYNMVVDSGHDWWRSAGDGTQIHHNLFIHTTGPDGGFGGGILVYSQESGVDIHSNTFDGGGEVGQFYAPPIVIGDGSVFASMRNNVFTGFSEIADSFDDAMIDGPPGSVQYVDYNAFDNPLAPSAASYAANLAGPAMGEHDVDSATFAGEPEIPYQISAGCIWSRTYTTAQVLAHYREMYTPADDSALIDAGDPADGDGVDIGAIGAGAPDPADQFGLGSE